MTQAGFERIISVLERYSTTCGHCNRPVF